MISRLITSLENNLGENLNFNEFTNTIYDDQNKRLFTINLIEKEIKLEASWIKKKDRVKYFEAAYAATKDNEFQYSQHQLRDYLSYKGNIHSYEPDIHQALIELKESLSLLEQRYDYGLMTKSQGARHILHIIHPDTTFEIRWSVDPFEWDLYFGYGKNPAYLNKKIKRGKLTSEINELIQGFVNVISIQQTFGKGTPFSAKYPLWCDYLWKNLNISSVEYEKFSLFVEEKTDISPHDLEFELANSRKSNKIKTLMFSLYKIGGEDVYKYHKDLKTDFPPDEIYFKIR